MVRQAAALAPDALLLGHSGSTSGHPVVAELTRELRRALPSAWIVYGGVFPTYHWREVLDGEPQVDVIVRGEGEETAPRLMAALEAGAPLEPIAGLAFRKEGRPHATPAAPVVRDLDAHRIGWELIDHARYSYWGGLRAVVVQFSRGCPHPCNYCGQRGFWTRWRHRDPVKLAAEIARLHREHGVIVFNFADENPTASPRAWRACASGRPSSLGAFGWAAAARRHRTRRGVLPTHSHGGRADRQRRHPSGRGDHAALPGAE